ncbi:hypothetical protein ABW22_11435 [Thiobacillus denitrificans]|uniref:Uncharacterized protein n=1 Tax=Thiobacillus denitrificans TaxID=36861 RepID=A0A106BLH4_THIDE|nr:hypothetical protein ABW22_11435 [Thiobacillus denitrificans]
MQPPTARIAKGCKAPARSSNSAAWRATRPAGNTPPPRCPAVARRPPPPAAGGSRPSPPSLHGAWQARPPSASRHRARCRRWAQRQKR